MNVHFEHISPSALRFLLHTSRDGSLPDHVEYHLRNCMECAQSLIDILAEDPDPPRIEIVFVDPDQGSEPVRETDHGGAGIAFPPVGPMLRSPCWSDEDLREQSVLMGTAEVSRELMLHVRTCAECSHRLRDYFRHYRTAKAFYRSLGLSKLFRRLLTKKWYRSRLMRAADGAKDQQ